jgi:hypothetical protein
MPKIMSPMRQKIKAVIIKNPPISPLIRLSFTIPLYKNSVTKW